jgi:hypothetical protein
MPKEPDVGAQSTRGRLSLVPATSAPAKRLGDRAARIWADERLRKATGTREVVLALEHLLTRRNPPAGKPMWTALREMLGTDQTGRPRMRELIGDDAPRYEPDRAAYWLGRICEAPRVRPRPYDPSGRPPSTMCDANATLDVVEADPVTGWEIRRWYCTRHRDHYERVQEQIKQDAATREKVEPIPSRGGLLPCYFQADWERVYAKYRPHWKPPVYGLSADDWPAPGRAAGRIIHPRLRVVTEFDVVGTP